MVTQSQNGAELAAKEINEAGGINGMMIETKAEDDENDPEEIHQRIQHLSKRPWGYAGIRRSDHFPNRVSL